MRSELATVAGLGVQGGSDGGAPDRFVPGWRRRDAVRRGEEGGVKMEEALG